MQTAHVHEERVGSTHVRIPQVAAQHGDPGHVRPYARGGTVLPAHVVGDPHTAAAHGHVLGDESATASSVVAENNEERNERKSQAGTGGVMVRGSDRLGNDLLDKL